MCIDSESVKLLMRRVFLAPKTHVFFKLIDKKIITILRKLFLLDWPYADWNILLVDVSIFSCQL